MIKSLAFVVYPVNEISAAREFYENFLGLRLTHEFGGGWFEYDLGDTTFAISKADAQNPAPVKGAVAAFEVEDLDAEIVRLKRASIQCGEVVDTPVCRFLTVKDPSGNPVMLHQRRRVS